jgi:flagellar basal body-associated protein FliL
MVFNQKTIDDLKENMDEVKNEVVSALNAVFGTAYVVNIFFDGILWP